MMAQKSKRQIAKRVLFFIPSEKKHEEMRRTRLTAFIDCFLAVGRVAKRIGFDS
jgi:hypothetical protein